jgi:ATP-dependent Clp protease ATP-binding subunit ClpA
MKGRRAVSEDDLRGLMIGVFNPDKPPSFRQDSGIIKAIEQINRELETDYNIKDFVDLKELKDIEKKYSMIPLGLSESEREQFLKTTIEGKREEIIRPAIKEMRERIQDQRSELPKPQVPIPNVPMPNIAPVTASVNPNTGLTRTETALLSPEEQIIAARGRGGIMDLV